MTDINIKIGGEAGQGMQTIGAALVKAFARGGLEVFAWQDYMSRIRGGHNFFSVRISDRQIVGVRDDVDILVALGELTVNEHIKEVVPAGVVIFDGEYKDKEKYNAVFLNTPLTKLAQEKGGNKLYINSVATGVVFGLLRYDMKILEDIFVETFGRKHADTIDANKRAAQAGYDYAVEFCKGCVKQEVRPDFGRPKKLAISGNEALALGALAGGCRFISAYPMTPSTGIMTYIAGHMEDLGVVVEQAEDEIAAINMALGASFAGARAMTATSGGGFCLMTEGVGLAGMTETPIVIVVAQRPGPSTGLPTRTEQGDLQFVLHASQGEFPRAILTPTSAEDAFYLAAAAFNLADKYQTSVFVMSDQHLADSYWTIAPYDLSKIKIERHILSAAELAKMKEYNRHQLSPDGISPRALPGASEKIVVTDSDEHTENGHLTEDLNMRVKMTEKRMRKLEGLKQEALPPVTYGQANPEILLVGWGSSYGAIKEAVCALNSNGKPARMLALRQVWPLPSEAVKKELANAKASFIVENNATGQMYDLIKQELLIAPAGKILKYDGRPFSPKYILNELEKRLNYSVIARER